MSLIDLNALRPMADVLEFGEKKYSRNNWKKGMPWSEIVDCMLRHTAEFMDGRDIDPDSKQLHAGHIAANAMFLCYAVQHHLDKDDRGENFGKPAVVDMQEVAKQLGWDSHNTSPCDTCDCEVDCQAPTTLSIEETESNAKAIARDRAIEHQSHLDDWEEMLVRDGLSTAIVDDHRVPKKGESYFFSDAIWKEVAEYLIAHAKYYNKEEKMTHYLYSFWTKLRGNGIGQDWIGQDPRVLPDEPKITPTESQDSLFKSAYSYLENSAVGVSSSTLKDGAIEINIKKLYE